MKRTTRNILIPVQFAAYLALIVLSLATSWNVFLQFDAGDSSFKRSETPVEKIPTLTICFQPFNDHFEMGLDFNISKYLSWGEASARNKNRVLTEGFNPSLNNATLTTLSTAFNGKCYKIDTVDLSDPSYYWQLISVDFREDIPIDRIPLLQVMFTSEENSYGIMGQSWKDGDNLVFKLPHNVEFTEYGLSEERYNFIPEKRQCRTLPFYECLGINFMKQNFDDCPRKCLPYSLPSKIWLPANKSQLCEENSEEHSCARKIFWNMKTGEKFILSSQI